MDDGQERYEELLRADAAAVLDDDLDDEDLDEDAFDRALVARMKSFLGHIEDMSEAERLFMLGALWGALIRRLGPKGG